ncbi:MAG: NAD(+)/NADH kinase, partial [Candidatus Diapherotrites archaeon]|nr:NAD(+)/NADH kinase [Candidatus Diapherotrites archaeon]
LPGVEALAVAPISPHNTRLRPIVVPAQSAVQLRFKGTHPALSLDGRDKQPLPAGGVLEAKVSKKKARLVQLESTKYLEKLARFLG